MRRSFWPSGDEVNVLNDGLARASTEGPIDYAGDLLLPLPSSRSRQEIRRMATMS